MAIVVPTGLGRPEPLAASAVKRKAASECPAATSRRSLIMIGSGKRRPYRSQESGPPPSAISSVFVSATADQCRIASGGRVGCNMHLLCDASGQGIASLQEKPEDRRGVRLVVADDEIGERRTRVAQASELHGIAQAAGVIPAFGHEVPVGPR